jgi:hypothetical protein
MPKDQRIEIWLNGLEMVSSIIQLQILTSMEDIKTIFGRTLIMAMI